MSRDFPLCALLSLVVCASPLPGQVTKSSSKNSGKHAAPTFVNQEQSRDDLRPGVDPENKLVIPLARHMLTDQENFWTAPLHLRMRDLHWILPVAATTGVLIAGDSWLSHQVPDSPSQLQRSRQISNYAVYSLIGAAGGAYLLGHLTHNEHMRETGFLAGEAAVDSTLATYAFKEAFRRARPYQDNGDGRFFAGGSSFPSEHSTIAWSVAGVLAHEYPGPLTKIAAYGLATTITLTRVTGKEHFASDVAVGGLLGWYFGREVYRAHHDPELGGSAWRSIFDRDEEDQPRNPKDMGSPPVPTDSWVYPLFERLIALGYVRSAYLGMRPWSRMECARLLDQAGEYIRDSGLEDTEGAKIYSALVNEFQPEINRLNGGQNLGVAIDSIYLRGTQISGPALTDGYHFGQTIINDYGRPYASGFNAIAGITAHAVAGPFSISVRGEYQHAPGVPSSPANVLDAIAQADQILPVSNALGTRNRFTVLEASVGVTLHNVQISFGRQNHWLGPDESGPFLFSNNAQPVTELDIQSVSPFHFPLFSRLLGPARMEFSLGQLAGQQWLYNPPNLLGPGFSPQPFFHADKITFRPTPNLEIGAGITAIFGGPGLPFTLKEFLRSYYSHKATITANPAKRSSALDFTYRVPGLRNWLMVYADTMVGDEISPVGSSRALVNPGIFLPRIPGIPKLDFRAEFAREPLTREFPPGFVYYDRRYRSGFTNDGNLMGSWVGRAGTGGRLWATYWLSPHANFQLGYREQHVSRRFLEGGQLHDIAASGEFLINSTSSLEATLQYERWHFPLLATGPQSNVLASVEWVFHPHWRLRK